MTTRVFDQLILSVEDKGWADRRDFWLQKKFLSEAQLQVASVSDFVNEWPDLKKQASCLLVNDHKSNEVLSQFSSLPSEIELLQSCDCILRVKDKWWLRNFWAQALREALVARAQKLDTHRVAYLTGQGGHAMASLVVLAQLGFKRILWVVSDLEQNEALKKIFLKHFFGVTLEFVLGDELTRQPNNGSILINTLGASSEAEFLQDLIYLNFLQKGGVVVETQLDTLESQLLVEAESVGVHSVAAWFLEGLRDHKLLTELKAQDLPTESEFLNEWFNFLKTRPTLSHN